MSFKGGWGAAKAGVTAFSVVLGSVHAGHATTASDPAMSVTVSASRFELSLDQVPLPVSAFSQDDLEDLGLHDAADVLTRIPGMSVGPGSDDGSAGFTPSLLGRREKDDFLLVIDGVPAGGAYAPQFNLLSIEGADRIEMIRGSSPVFLGATSFAGTLTVDHAAAGAARESADASFGPGGARRLSASGSPVSEGAWLASVFVDEARDATDEVRSTWQRDHVLLRTREASSGVRLDLDWVRLTDQPSSPTPLIGTTPALGSAVNLNPVDALANQTNGRVTVGYDSVLGDSRVGAVLSWAHNNYGSNRGFVDDVDSGVGSGYLQSRRSDDLYADVHLTRPVGDRYNLLLGFSALGGSLRSDNSLYSYALTTGGETEPPAEPAPVLGKTGLRDHRSLAALYSELRWSPSAALAVTGGLRANQLAEHLTTLSADGSSDDFDLHAARLSGSLGMTWVPGLLKDGNGRNLTVYSSAFSTFQPPQIDLGPAPDAGAGLVPEELRGLMVGMRGQLLHQLEWEVSAHAIRVDHRSAVAMVDGQPTLQATGTENVRGVEFEVGDEISDHWRLEAEFSYNDARYGAFGATNPDGDLVNLEGQPIELVAPIVSSLHLDWRAQAGWWYSAQLRYVGPRTVTPFASDRLGGYAEYSLRAGYRSHRWSFQADAANLSDRRDPVVASELGDGQIYRLTGRRFRVGVGYSVR